ncbi:hypothetical protein KVF89_04490 [Nocardioides carbamazepini]|uniref:hypothetical protein n=1 Tax=Nocardioides carbamazepini TaxID=2854259 RepID=UPI00214A1A22|nr:hypothetical protein [Nocardioides carbamazepini]MCR1781786.1 hypothetical protein [Nocardioides carbamazepini]
MLALLAGVLAIPAGAVAADPDPDAPFVPPALFWKDWPSMFDAGPGDEAGYLRTGGVNCPRPEPLAASEAGSGHGYRVPFLMALTDGRVLANYSPVALSAGQLPFGASVYGVTGWVRGWVALPSLRIEVPDDAVTLCPGSGVSWAEGFAMEPRGSFGLVVAAADGIGSNRAWTELTPVGAPRASITGLTSSGELEFSASMKVEVHAKQVQGDDATIVRDCATTVEMRLGTTPDLLPAAFAPLEGALPSDPSRWTSQQEYDRFYQDPVDMKSAPPARHQMPPRALDGALPGRSATMVNATAAVPALVCPPGSAKFGQFLQGTLAPLNRDGYVQPGTVRVAGRDTDYASMLKDPRPLFEIPAGAVQTAIDITIDDVGMPRGLPTGYGFSS